MSDLAQSDGPPFVGESPEEGVRDEPPSLKKALERAAEKASKAGYAGTTFQVQVELVPAEHNQWVKTYRVIASDGTD